MYTFGWSTWGAFTVASVVIWTGVFCTLFPYVPGPLIAWAGVLVHRLWMHGDSVSWWFVGLGFFLMLTAQFSGYALTLLKVRRFGVTWKCAVGALTGAAGGAFFGPLGIILGSFVLAMLFEWIDLRDKCRDTGADTTTLVANLVAVFCKVVMTAAYGVAFYLFLPVYPWSMW